MATRYIRDTVILAKNETTYGTDSVPTGAANAIAVSNVRITPLDISYVSRDLLRAYFGASEQLPGVAFKRVSYDVEAVGSGTAGTAPAWGPLLRASGWSEAATVGTVVAYRPVTNNQEAVSQYVYDSGVLHKLIGSRGMVTLDMSMGNIPKFSFDFLAIDGGDSAATPSGVSYAAFQPPQVVTDQFTGSLTIGGTFSALSATPAITGGTVYPSQGLTLDPGIKAEYMGLLDGQSVEITDRQAKAKITLDVTAAQEVAFYDDVRAGTLRSLGLLHGTVTGRRFGVWLPGAQLTNPTKADMKGKRLMSYDLVLPPSAAGNDEITIVTSW